MYICTKYKMFNNGHINSKRLIPVYTEILCPLPFTLTSSKHFYSSDPEPKSQIKHKSLLRT